MGEIGDDIISLINEFIDSRGFAIELDNHKFEIEMDATEINLYKKQKRIFLMIILLIYSIILFIVLVMNLNLL